MLLTRKITLLFFLMLALQDFTFAQSRKDQTVLNSEKIRFEAMVNRDTSRLKSFIDDDMIYLHSNGIRESKQQHLESIASGAIRYKSMQRDDAPVVRRYGRTALVNGRVSVDGALKGNEFSIILLYTAVYRKKKGRWVLLNWQSTKVDRE